MKQVVVQSFCDLHDGVMNVRAAEEETYNGMVLDLCEEHAAEVRHLISQISELFEAGVPIKDGRRPMRKGPPPAAKTGRGTNRVASRMKETEAWRTCPECGHIPPTRSALGAHMRSHHGARLRDYEWST